MLEPSCLVFKMAFYPKKLVGRFLWEISSMRPLVDGHSIFHLHYESHGLAYGCVCSSVGGYECSHSMEDTCIYVLTHDMKLLRDILHYDEFT